eukprot:g28474.t1
MLAGVVNVFMSTPLWVVNTHMKLQERTEEQKKRMRTAESTNSPCDADGDPYRSTWSCFQHIARTEGIQGLYRGVVPSLFLVANPAIQFVTYEQMCKALIKYEKRMGLLPKDKKHLKLTSLQYFLLGALAKAVATVLTYPYQVVKSRFEAKSTSHLYRGLIHAFFNIYKQEGPHAFFAGMPAKLTQTVLNAAFMFAVYEKILHILRRFLHYRSLPVPPVLEQLTEQLTQEACPPDEQCVVTAIDGDGPPSAVLFPEIEDQTLHLALPLTTPTPTPNPNSNPN